MGVGVLFFLYNYQKILCGDGWVGGGSGSGSG